MIRPALPAAVILSSLVAFAAFATPAAADTAAGPHFAAWQSCLTEAFDAEGSRASRPVAADAALRACRTREDAYLAALAASPLLDGEDVARARPALITRVRDRLIGASLPRVL